MVKLTSLKIWVEGDGGYDYPHGGLSIHFSRNSLGTLVGGFYVPTATFAILCCEKETW